MNDGTYKGKSVALALGGGGARGLAHISVLQALDDLGVRPVAIAGTSIGAIIGAAYAAGHGGAALRAHTEALFADPVGLARRIGKSRARRRWGWFDVARPALLDGERFLDNFWPAPMPNRFEDLRIPLAVIATDFHKRREVAFSSGALRPAVAGSMALPGVIRAQPYEQGYLVDGGLANPLPYDHLRGEADIIVAIDLNGVGSLDEPKGPPTPLQTLIVSSQIMMSAVSIRMVAENPPDVLIAPGVAQYLALDISKTKKIFAAGDACRETLREGLEKAAARL